MDIRHLRATHALVDPTHHIAQNALHVVVQLLLFFAGAPIGFSDYGYLQQIIQNLVAYFVEVDFFQLFLHVADLDLVVMHGVKHRSSGAGYPSGVGACFRVCNFLLQHRSHQIGHGPHAFTDLCFAA